MCIVSNLSSIYAVKDQMVHFCAVPGCSNRYGRNTSVSFYALPLKNKRLLKIWIHKIGRKDLPINASTRICSDHFVNAAGRRLQPDEYPSVNLPVLSTTVCQPKPRKPPTLRPMAVEPIDETTSEESNEVSLQVVDVGVQASDDSQTTIVRLSQTISNLEEQLHASKFCLENISKDDDKVLFYTGFSNYTALKVCYNYLGPAVDNLTYWGSKKDSQSKCHGRNRLLLPVEEFYMVLVRLRLGLFEKDLADRFNVSISTVSRICRTWITFLYMRFKELPLWPSRDLVQTYMPRSFKDLYPSTRGIPHPLVHIWTTLVRKLLKYMLKILHYAWLWCLKQNTVYNFWVHSLLVRCTFIILTPPSEILDPPLKLTCLNCVILLNLFTNILLALFTTCSTTNICMKANSHISLQELLIQYT